MTPFDYPEEPHQRKHGPSGYRDADSFRPWLRDEFTFRCVYCLRREVWEPGQSGFDIDHLIPVARSGESELQYDNLLYSCRVCNSVKSVSELPDPSQTLCSVSVKVEQDGRIVSNSLDARRIIRVLGLDDAEFVQFRLRWIKILSLAKLHDPELYRQLAGFPEDLPNLELLRPPGGNTRMGGIASSFHRLRERGELPDVY